MRRPGSTRGRDDVRACRCRHVARKYVEVEADEVVVTLRDRRPVRRRLGRALPGRRRARAGDRRRAARRCDGERRRAHRLGGRGGGQHGPLAAARAGRRRRCRDGTTRRHVRGAGVRETRLKVEEGGDDVADDRAQNRRVELRYSGTTPGERGLEVEEHELDPVTAELVPGDRPRVEPVTDTEPVVEKTVVVPNEDGRQEEVRVGIEPIVVRGSLMRLRLQLTPLGPVDGDEERISVYAMTGAGELHPSAVDPARWSRTHRSAAAGHASSRPSRCSRGRASDARWATRCTCRARSTRRSSRCT